MDKNLELKIEKKMNKGLTLPELYKELNTDYKSDITIEYLSDFVFKCFNK